MTDCNLEKLKDVCDRVRENILNEYTWKWDEEFFAALLVVNQDDIDQVLSVVSKEFDQEYDFATLDDSTGNINKFINSVFGMVPGQRIFAFEAESDLILFATWWPWGNGLNISLRIGILSPDDHTVTKEEIKEHLVDWFALLL